MQSKWYAHSDGRYSVKRNVWLPRVNPLNAELNTIRHLLALVGATIFSTLAGYGLTKLVIAVTDRNALGRPININHAQ